MRKVIFLNSASPGTVVQLLALNVANSAAEVFFAAAGTPASERSCCGLARSTQSSGQAPA